MDQLGFYPLSVILSFLKETEGTSLLLTKRSYALQTLARFRLKNPPGLVVVGENARRRRRNRHEFRVSPVQDPTVLLARLNTRRLAKRRQQGATRYGWTTDELAKTEWLANLQSRDGEYEFAHPPSLELLRFLHSNVPWRSTLEDEGSNFTSTHELTLLVSYPRSGNTLVRTLLERITGIVTGSDTRPDRTLSKALAEQHNLVGEGVTQSSKTWCVKTHWPERTGYRPFMGHKVVLIVRNPFDAIDSYWNLNATNTHTETVTDDVYARFQNLFDQLVKNEIRVWINFHIFWLQECKNNQLPLLIMRFEDLMEDSHGEMVRLFEFLSSSAGNLSPFWRQRILHSTKATPKEDLGSYRPRTATTGIMSVGKSLCKERYTKQVLRYIHEAAATKLGPDGENLLRKFGYDMEEQHFPANFQQGCTPELPLSSFFTGESKGTTWVNKGATIRPHNCAFGRSMRNWRREHTKNDTEPFPTVSRRSLC